MIHKTGYAGSHRWEIRDKDDGAHSNYDWDCSCGEHGHVATTDIVVVLECFARHATNKVEEAAVEALRIFASKATADSLSNGADNAMGRGRTDLANILITASNYRSEIEEAEAES